MSTSSLEPRNTPLASLKRWARRRRVIADGHSHPLAFAKSGQEYRVVGVLGEHEFHFDPCFEREHTPEPNMLRRLLEMGLVPGTRVDVMRAGDPVTIGLWGGRTALSGPLAHAIFVVPA